MTKKPPLTVAKLKKEADAWFSRYIRYRDGKHTENGWVAQCITCDTWYPYGKIQAGHFMSRRYNSTRYDEENVNAQCQGCNVWRYGEQYKYAKALEFKYGDGTAEKLAQKSAEPHKFTTAELLDITQKCKQEIKDYEQTGIVYE